MSENPSNRESLYEERRARDQHANAQIGADPLVQELVAGFDATIESVKPAD